MNTNINTLDSTGEKRIAETSVQNISHNLTTIQSIQGIQNIVQSNAQTIQSPQSIVSTIAPTSTIVGKSISLDLNPKLSLMKSVVQTGPASTVDANKITTTLCSVGSTVRIISPGMLNTVERQSQPQSQVQAQVAQQVVTTIPATYHVPRGPAAVANISAPRSTVATPIVKASGGQPVVPISRTGVATTVSNTTWPTKTSVVYAQPQRHVMPPVSRVTTRPSPAVYSGQQPRLVVSTQARPIQGAVVAGAPTGSTPRLLTPVLQPNNTITRIPVSQTRPTGPQVANITSTVQTVRHQPQTLQTNQHATRAVTAQTNRITVSTPVVVPTTRIAAATSVTVQPAIGRQLSINPTTGTATAGFNRVVIPTQQIQQQQQPQSQQHGTRVVQTITSLANIGTVSRVIATTTNPSNVARVSQSTPTSVARITGMTLHSLPIATTRTIPAPVKPVVAGQAITQTVQIKSGGPPTALRVTPVISTTAMVTTATTVPIAAATTAPTATIIINNSNNSNNSPTSTPQSSIYTQYRQASVQPVRLLVEPIHEEGHGKPNSSPRPSILRKRDRDNSPAKSIAKNLVPVLTALSSGVVMPPSSPPSPSRNDRDGCQSSGSTTVSATSSPGLDEEPEQSRIIINQTMEMSPRKKPRKQQLTGVELTEPRCTDEEMQFITEDKLKREKDDIKDKYCMDRKMNVNNQQDEMGMRTNSAIIVRTRPTPSLLGSSWKNRWSTRLHHYRRPSDVRPREERRPTVAEIAQQKYVLQKIHGWKIYQLTAQMEDLAELEKQMHEKLKATLLMLESQQSKSRQDDELERANDLIKGNMQRSSLISEGMSEARAQLVTIFQHKSHVNDILQRSGSKRAQKKRDK
ncbi:hypothetical protein PV326_003076 [Microctonus aethiopoides]|nr:hypothetical protein PV326_003076 [Microctonus aethiopoides]